MPKLNTTIDNLEWKSNKVTGVIPSEDWTDAQYPSAKALYNAYNTLLSNVYPVDSIITTATNTNPAAALGGTWTLVDKTFKTRQVKLDSTYWTATNATLGTGGSGTDSESICSWADHGINIRLRIITSVELTDALFVMGKLNLSKLGITSLPYSILFDAAHSDGGQGTINYCFYKDGTVETHDAIHANGSHSIASGSYFYVNIQEEVPHTLMDDSFCDKFYWKRTA